MNIEGNLFTMRDAWRRPVSIRNTSGIVVVTSEDDCCDHILEHGETLRLRPRGLLAIRSLSPEARATVFGGKLGREGRILVFGGN